MVQRYICVTLEITNRNISKVIAMNVKETNMAPVTL